MRGVSTKDDETDCNNTVPDSEEEEEEKSYEHAQRTERTSEGRIEQNDNETRNTNARSQECEARRATVTTLALFLSPAPERIVADMRHSLRTICTEVVSGALGVRRAT